MSDKTITIDASCTELEDGRLISEVEIKASSEDGTVELAHIVATFSAVVDYIVTHSQDNLTVDSLFEAVKAHQADPNIGRVKTKVPEASDMWKM